MNTKDITLYEPTNAGAIEEFDDTLDLARYRFTIAQLIHAGLHHDEIANAISRAMKVCRLNGINSGDHFRNIYVVEQTGGNVSLEWRMTKQGATLVMLNVITMNPAVARYQWELVSYCAQDH